MKRILFASGLSVLAVGMAAVLLGSAAPTVSKDLTVRGEVVDLYCDLSQGARGADHKECALACAKAGQPIGLVDADGNAYLLLSSDKHKPDRDALIAKMADTVSVTGTVAKRGGLQAIYWKGIQ